MFDFIAGLPGQMATLIGRLTATRATNLDNIDAAVSTRAAASTALSTATWTNALAADIALIPSIPTSAIKSIQFISVSMTTSLTSATATITSVNTAKSMMVGMSLYNDSSSAAAAACMATFTLTNATTVTVNRGVTGGNIYCKAFVVEFN